MQEVTGSNPVAPTAWSDRKRPASQGLFTNVVEFMDDKVKITFPDGSVKEYAKGVRPWDILEDIGSQSLKKKALVAKVNGRYVDLDHPITEDAELVFITYDDPEGLEHLWHSTAHIMAHAIKDLFPEAQFGVGPPIETGFYYDVDVDRPLTPEDLERIEKRMQEIVRADERFERRELSKEEAIELFKKRGDRYKLELLEDLDDEHPSIYVEGDFIDLCRGPHIPSTGRVRYFKLLNIAGAYWRGDERNKMLQRVYGVAFPRKEQLDEYLHLLEEAKKRDHRKLGKELDLFSFQKEGPGFIFWHPKGMILYRAIELYIRDKLLASGYGEIKTPQLLREELWHRSGHWDNYKDNMYFVDTEDGVLAIKPMNCPGACLVYANTLHSYRDLPLRLAEFGVVHRNERSGVLAGLFRVRQFTQDDAHIFCTPEQIEDEVVRLMHFVEEVYHDFGFDDYRIELSTRPEKSIGTDEMWQQAEEALSKALKSVGVDYTLNPGEGAFYGPKIDFHVRDVLKRSWQCGTIQLDFSMPERFDLEYVGADGNRHRPVMIHRAIVGSIERFVGNLIEHYGGAFPVWLAPVQVRVLPITDNQVDYAREVVGRLQEHGLRVELDDRSEKVGYKIREAETQKIPYMLILGEREVERGEVSVRRRKKGDLGASSLDDFLDRVKDEIDRKALD